MPYIESKSRPRYVELVAQLSRELAQNNFSTGDINYCLSKLIWDIFDLQGGRYRHANELMGVLECVKTEFYRRKVAPYEDKKIIEHGDIQ